MYFGSPQPPSKNHKTKNFETTSLDNCISVAIKYVFRKMDMSWNMLLDGRFPSLRETQTTGFTTDDVIIDGVTLVSRRLRASRELTQNSSSSIVVEYTIVVRTLSPPKLSRAAEPKESHVLENVGPCAWVKLGRVASAAQVPVSKSMSFRG